MPSTCRSVLKSCLAQFVREDVCGAPAISASGKITTKGYVSVTATAQIEDGEEFILKNACGELCINEKECDTFKRYDLEILLCQINPNLLELATDARLLLDNGGNAKGFARGESTACDNFSLEMWNKVTPADCGAGVAEWYYFAFPFVTNGLITDLTFENGPLTMTITAHTRGANALWAQGPACVLPDTAAAIAGDHLLGYVTDVQPPEPDCEFQAVTAPDLVCEESP